MASKLKSDTARANGAKSRSPKSAATREKSSRNSLRHGLTSRHILVLECESEGEFQQLENETKVTRADDLFDAMLVALSGRIEVEDTADRTAEDILREIFQDRYILRPRLAAPG